MRNFLRNLREVRFGNSGRCITVLVTDFLRFGILVRGLLWWQPMELLRRLKGLQEKRFRGLRL